MNDANSGPAAYERLRHAIMRLELAPAAAVSEAQLVGAFGFSTAAVRAALARELQAGDGPRAAELMAAAIGAFRDELVESLQRAALDVPLPGQP